MPFLLLQWCTVSFKSGGILQFIIPSKKIKSKVLWYFFFEGSFGLFKNVLKKKTIELILSFQIFFTILIFWHTMQYANSSVNNGSTHQVDGVCIFLHNYGCKYYLNKAKFFLGNSLIKNFLSKPKYLLKQIHLNCYQIKWEPNTN